MVYSAAPQLYHVARCLWHLVIANYTETCITVIYSNLVSSVVLLSTDVFGLIADYLMQ